MLGDETLDAYEAVGAVLDLVAEGARHLREDTQPSEVRSPIRPAGARSDSAPLKQRPSGPTWSGPSWCPSRWARRCTSPASAKRPTSWWGVYDLGAGTFDTAVLRRTTHSFQLAGPPGGFDGMGGEDFDDRLYLRLGRHLEAHDAELWHKLQTSRARIWRKAAADLRREGRRAKRSCLGEPPPR